MGYNPNEPRNADGQWADGGSAIRAAASDIIGGKVEADEALKQHTDYTEKVMKELNIKDNIKLQVTNDKTAGGYAVPDLSPDEKGHWGFKDAIRINPKFSNTDQQNAIRHEMKHISQYKDGRYYKALNAKGEKAHYWDGKEIITQDDMISLQNSINKGNNRSFEKYRNLPWEIDARKFENKN